jgi:ElaB/YqjD/DUF883 family membrane-anchored ribosome-binding protein
MIALGIAAAVGVVIGILIDRAIIIFWSGD